MALHKILQKPIPSELLAVLNEVTIYPQSVRLAEKLFDTGISLIKENNLYLPFIHYKAQLTYLNDDQTEAVSLLYQRVSNFIGIDSLLIIKSNLQEGVSVRVDRGRNIKEKLRKTPINVTITNGHQGKLDKNNSTSYALLL